MTYRKHFSILSVFITSLPFGAGAGLASFDSSSACLAAADQAATESMVPEALLRAITVVETGRGQARDPWPWTVNSLGKGHWFATRGEAVAFARAELAAGRDGFDAGCFQMNFRWHGERFDSIEAMFDPLVGARAAAGFLEELQAEKGNWTDAAAAYHSRDPELARTYLERIAAIVGAIASTPPSRTVPDRTAPRFNRYPLLAAGGGGAPGSLVPLTTGRGRLIGGS